MKQVYSTVFFFIMLFIGCEIAAERDNDADNKEDVLQEDYLPIAIDSCALEDSIKFKGLINVQEINPDIRVHLRYSGLNNFLNKDIYGCLTNACLQTETAEMLSEAQEELSTRDPNLHLLIWDAARPRSVQWKMWNTLEMPIAQKTRYVSNPRNGSIHNYGCAVDLTICEADGKQLDMGTDFDYFGKTANTNMEFILVQNGELNYQQLDNRKLLRQVMRKAGFNTISSEWWHFNAMSRAEARKRYEIVE